MVSVHFKLSEAGSVSLSLGEATTCDDVLQECAAKAGVELGGYIAIRNQKVISPSTLIHGDDEIDVFPAISGG